MTDVKPSASSGTVLTKIEQLLASETSPLTQKIGFDSGLLGLACFHYLRFLRLGSGEALEREAAVIETVFSKLNEGYVYHDMYREMADLAWYLSEHADRLGYATPAEKENLLSDFDAILADQLRECLKQRNFDPVNGALKYGYYFLSRVKDNAALGEQLIKIIEFLDASAQRLPASTGLYWVARFDESRQSMYTGIAHGIANILLFCVYCQRKIKHQAVTRLIRGCISALTERITLDSPNIFPVILGKTYREGQYPKNYVYGDYSTLFALLVGLRATGQPRQLARYSRLFDLIHQKGYGPTYFDAGPSIIYGDAGLLMVFNRFREAFNPRGINAAIRSVHQRLIDRYEATDDRLGFSGHWNQHLPWTNLCFGEGLLGIHSVLASVEQPALFGAFDKFYFLRG